MWHMFYGLFGTQNLMVELIFKFDLRKDQCQVKQGHFLKKKTDKNMPILSSFVSGFQKKMLFIFKFNN